MIHIIDTGRIIHHETNSGAVGLGHGMEIVLLDAKIRNIFQANAIIVLAIISASDIEIIKQDGGYSFCNKVREPRTCCSGIPRRLQE